MNIGNKIKISKAAVKRVFTPKESAFLFSIINDTGSMSSAYDAMRKWTGEDIEAEKVIVDGFSCDEHTTISYSILSKVEDEIITADDLEEMVR